MSRQLRASYDEPGLVHEVLELLALVFPFFGPQERAARELGLRWESCSTPFVVRDEGRVVAHVGVIDMPVIMQGERRAIGSVHAVATHPERRRRGAYRAIMEELLEWCGERYETLHLCTDNPEYFEPFGFRIVDECHFTMAASALAPAPDAPKATPLADPAHLHRLLARRTPVSELFGTYDRQVFLFNEARHLLHWAEDLDAVLSYDLEDGCLKLWDVVAAEMPALAEILARIDGTFDRVEVHFAPDRLEADGLEPVPDPRTADVMMARGPYPPEGRAIKFPASSRC